MISGTEEREMGVWKERSILCFVVFFLSIAGLASAGEERGEGNVFTLGEVAVYGEAEGDGNSLPDKVYEEDMRLFNRETLAGAVNLLPGVTRSRTGARNESTIFVRGFDIKHVPVFLDGIPIYVPYDGYPDLGRFTTFDLSEIVLSKGLSSVLYGPNAMGGAINMVSRKPEKAFEGSAGAGFSSGETWTGYLNMGANFGKWYLQGGASVIDSDYFSLSDGFVPTATEDGGRRENSYYHDDKLNLKLGLTPTPDSEYALSYIRQHGKKGTPPYAGSDPSVTPRYWQWPYWDKDSLYFTSKTPIGQDSYLKLRAYYDTFKNSLFSFDDATYSTISKKYAFRSWYDDYTYGGSAEIGTKALENNSIAFSLTYKRDIHREHNEGNPIQRFEDEIISVGLEDSISLGKCFSAVAGIGYDRVRTIEAQDLDQATKTLFAFPTGEASSLTPQIGLFYAISETGKVHAAISRKTRLPSIKDKYSYRLGTALPNPDLKPEKAMNYEVGYEEVLAGKVRVKTTAFYSNVSDFILFATVADPGNPGKILSQNQNIGRVDQYGLEADILVPFSDWIEAGMNYTWLYRDNRSNTDKLTNTPENKLFAYLKCSPLKGLTLLGDMEYDSSRYSSTDGNRVADGFVLFNAKVSYEVVRNMTIEAGVKNIFDKNYELEEGYPEPGRNAFVQMSYRW
ncbi:MAG: TonB-dependent receptor [Thermodesulfovibrionales bacterium]|jgi:iron complex outermembrane receptor protein